MASPAKSPFPRAFKLSIDDLGDFILMAGERLPIGALVLGAQHAEGAVCVGLQTTLHGGALWTVSGSGPERELVPGEGWDFGGQSYAVCQPDPASPLLWLRPEDSDRPGLLLMAEGLHEGFDLGLPGSAWALEGVEHSITFSALESGLRFTCEGGVRFSKGDGDFDGARPFQEVAWACSGQQMLWNSVRSGSGAPLFITLEALAMGRD